jgi:four helix bundle suffix protein
VANILICLLDQQFWQLEQEFLQAGGLRERVSRARLAFRSGNSRRIKPCTANVLKRKPKTNGPTTLHWLCEL